MGPDAVLEAPPAPSAPPPPQKEAAPPKEVPAVRQRKEIEKVSSNILYRGLAKVKEKEQAGTPLTQGDKKLKVLIEIEELKPNKALVFNDNSITFMLTNEITSGDKYPVRGVLKRADYASDNELMCQFEDQNGNPINPPRVLKREDVAIAQLLAEADPILSNFEGVEQDMIRQYISLRKDPEAPLPEGVNDLIKKTASEAGMLTVDDLLSLEQSIEAQAAQSTDPQEQTEKKTLVEGLQNLQIEGNLLDFENVSSVFGQIGYSPEKIGGQIESLQKDAEAAKLALNNNPNDEAARQKLMASNAEVLMLKQTAEALKDQGSLKQYFEQAEKGNIDLDKAKQFLDQFKKGNFDEILSQLPGAENMTDEEKEKVKAVFKAKGTLGLLLLLSLFSLGTFKSIFAIQ